MLRFTLLLFVLMAPLAHAGIVSYADQTQTDFDTAIQSLNAYGTWSKIDDVWAWTPLDHRTPYTDGRWLYTEYGWFWKGNAATSWATEHYGFWKRGADKIWSWFPLPDWLPQIVELRVTPDYVGWRCAAVDANGTFIESPSERFSHSDEWTFVTRVQFAGPITPGVLAKPEVVGQQLDISTSSNHSYQTYRAIDRPGPHPADFIAFSKDGGMFPPHTLTDDLAKQPPPPSPIIPGITPGITHQNVSVDRDAGVVDTPKLNEDANEESSEPPDPRQVKYWVTMSLPGLSAKPPPDAKSNEVYVYRPDFLQDQDGIERRIALWLDPKARPASLKEVLAGTSEPANKTTPDVAGPKNQDPFRGSLDESFHPADAPAASATPSKSPATNAAPSGRAH